MDNDADVSLSNLMGGQVVERFNDELMRLVANVVDPNTPATAKRSIKLDVTFKPDKNRDLGNIDVVVSSKLAPAEKISTRVFIALTKNGPVLSENNPRQPSLPEVMERSGATVTQLKAVNGGMA